MSRKFDRLVQFDPRSRNYPIRATLLDTQQAYRGYTWSCNVYNDQGEEGACVGFAWSHEIAARPMVCPSDHALATRLYQRARELDEWPGEDYDGTSILAGAKAAQEAGFMQEYRWAFGLNDLRLAVAYKGPAVLGVNWFEGMLDADEQGFIHPMGQWLGGHAILCHAVSERLKRFTLHNSWGPTWGVYGKCYVSFDDMALLLGQEGEACIPVIRRRGT